MKRIYYSFLTIHLLKDILAVSSFWLLLLPSILLYKFLCKPKFSFPWHKCPVHMITACLVFLRKCLFLRYIIFQAVPFYIPTKSISNSVSLHPYQHLVVTIFHFSMSVWLYLSVVLIYTFLMASWYLMSA